MNIKILSIVQSFPENVVTLSKFRGFVDKPGYDYQVFCWKSNPEAWNLWAADAPKQHRDKVLVSGATQALRPPFLGAWLRFFAFLLLHPGLSLRHLRYHLSKVGLFRACHRLLDDYKILQAKPDILHFEFGTGAVEKIYLKKLLGCKVVVSFRGFDLNFFKLGDNQVYQAVWDAADGFHFLGSDLLERARQRGFKGDKLIQLIPPGIDLALFSPSQTKALVHSSEIKVVSVGRLIWKKGLNFGLLAFSKFLKKGGRGTYHIIGEGPAWEELRYYAQELGIAGDVVFHGKCSPKQVQTLLNQSDVFLHPSISEGFCNAALEAQAMQLPVVCFAVGGLPENVVHGETGLLAPLGDWQQLAAYIDQLWANPNQRLQMGEKGRQRIAEMFNVEKQIAAFDELYQQVMQA